MVTDFFVVVLSSKVQIISQVKIEGVTHIQHSSIYSVPLIIKKIVIVCLDHMPANLLVVLMAFLLVSW